ncbi:hypothetical protein O3M35_008021 [Rhynocoris fuscipes]|uniref:Uncharacterized protein n=1 Tax=Rhynocoris fuscipes TaxID=488301 RepID=A0AAW1D7I3_9HEMI
MLAFNITVDAAYCDHVPDLSDSELEEWLDLDRVLQTSATMTIADICQELAGEVHGDGDCESTEEEEEIPDDPPTNAQMQEA